MPHLALLWFFDKQNKKGIETHAEQSDAQSRVSRQQTNLLHAVFDINLVMTIGLNVNLSVNNDQNVLQKGVRVVYLKARMDKVILSQFK